MRATYQSQRISWARKDSRRYRLLMAAFTIALHAKSGVNDRSSCTVLRQKYATRRSFGAVLVLSEEAGLLVLFFVRNWNESIARSLKKNESLICSHRVLARMYVETETVLNGD